MVFDYATNFSNGTKAVNSSATLIEYANYVSSGWLAYGFLAIIFGLVFLIGSASDSKKGMLSASFVTFIFSIYFLRLDIINPVFVFAMIIIMIASAIGIKAGGSQY